MCRYATVSFRLALVAVVVLSIPALAHADATPDAAGPPPSMVKHVSLYLRYIMFTPAEAKTLGIAWPFQGATVSIGRFEPKWWPEEIANRVSAGKEWSILSRPEGEVIEFGGSGTIISTIATTRADEQGHPTTVVETKPLFACLVVRAKPRIDADGSIDLALGWEVRVGNPGGGPTGPCQPGPAVQLTVKPGETVALAALGSMGSESPFAYFQFITPRVAETTPAVP